MMLLSMLFPLLSHADGWDEATYKQIEQSIRQPQISGKDYLITKFGAKPGATAAEICSVLYKKGAAAITDMVAELNDWMMRHHCESLDQLRGRLNASHRNDGDRFERIQFFSNISQAHTDLN